MTTLRVSRVAVSLLLAAFFMPVETDADDPLTICGYQDYPFTIEQLPADAHPWYEMNEDHMWLYNQYVDLWRYSDSDGSWGKNWSSEFGGFPSDDDLNDTWGFHWDGAYAMTCYWWLCDCCEIHEADIVFNPGVTWTPDPNVSEGNSGVVNYNTCLLHEMGHAIGMQDGYPEYYFSVPTVMQAYYWDQVHDVMRLHAGDVYLHRAQYKDSDATIPERTNMGVLSKWANSGWNNSTVNSTSIFQGDKLDIYSLTVENTGTTDVTSPHVRIYLCSDRSSVNTGCILVDDWWFDSFGHETYWTGNLTGMTVPLTTPPGTYYVGAIVTIDGYNWDDLWDDNTTHVYGAITVKALPPDFVVTGITLEPPSPVAGLSFKATVTVKNQGGAGSGGYLDVWRNQPAAVGCAGAGDSRVWIGNLAAGATTSYTFTGLQAGSVGGKTFRAFIDSQCATTESDEGNNQGTLDYTVVAPDFVVTGIALEPPSPVADLSFKATVTVKNQGVAGSAGYLDVWKDQPTAVGCSAAGDSRVWIADLAAGATASYTFTGLQAGTVGGKTFRAFIDSQCGTTESDEGNNQGTLDYTVVAPDFVVTGIALDPPSPVANATFKATVTVKNQGVAGSAGYLDVWKNQPTAVSCSAAGDSRVWIGDLAAGTTTSYTFTGLQAGTVGGRTFRAFVDSQCATTESDESNNQDTLSYSAIVTAESIAVDVNHFVATGDIAANLATSLLAKLDSAARARARGHCATAANIYSAFVNELRAQSGKKVDETAAAILIQEAQYLIDHCP